MCFHKICLLITIYCAMNPTAISLICIIKFSHTTGLFSFSSQTCLAIFFSLKPNKNNKLQPSLDPRLPSCNFLDLSIFIANATKCTINLQLPCPHLPFCPHPILINFAPHNSSERIIPWSLTLNLATRIGKFSVGSTFLSSHH